MKIVLSLLGHQDLWELIILYIEANESISKKDFVLRIKISRKEAKESRFWLRLVDTNNNEDLERERRELVQEATELMNIFSSIMRKSE